MFTCTRHHRRDCRDVACRGERDRGAGQRPVTDPATDPLSLANPTSVVHQAVFGGANYGAGDTSTFSSGSDCGSSSGSSSSYSADSGSSSSSCDSGGY